MAFFCFQTLDAQAWTVRLSSGLELELRDGVIRQAASGRAARSLVCLQLSHLRQELLNARVLYVLDVSGPALVLLSFLQLGVLLAAPER